MYLKQNKELLNKYNKNDWMIKKMNQVSARFNLYKQQVYYATFNDDSKALVQKISQQRIYDNPGSSLSYLHNTYIIIGCKQPLGNNSIEQLLLNLIHLIPIPQEPYSIVYINTLAPKGAYGDFKKIYQYLPFPYYIHLEKINVFQAGFMDKATQWLSFDPFYKFNVSKTYYSSEFQDLVEKCQIDAKKLLYSLPKEIINQLRNKFSLVKNLLNQQKQQEFLIMGSPLLNITQQNNQNNQWLHPKNIMHKPKPNILQNYQIGKTGAPLIFQLLLYYFNDHEEQLATQGLFRKSVDIQQQKNILNELQQNNYDFIERITNPHLVANVIKRFLSNLIIPIIPFELFNVLMLVQDNKMQQTVIQKIKNLQSTRKMIFLLLGEFFIDKILPYEQSNKMNMNNLAIVFGPCLMRSEVASIKDFIYTNKIIQIMRIIIQKFPLIFGNKLQRMRTIRQSVIMIQQQSLKQKLGNLHISQKQNQQQINQSIFIDFMRNLNEQQQQDYNYNTNTSPLKFNRIARSLQNINIYQQQQTFHIKLQKQHSLPQKQIKKQQQVKIYNQYIPIIQLQQQVIQAYSLEGSQNMKQSQEMRRDLNKKQEISFQNYFKKGDRVNNISSDIKVQSKQTNQFDTIKYQQYIYNGVNSITQNLEETDSFLNSFKPKKQK